MASVVTDRQEDRLVFPLCLSKCLFTPGIPIHRVMGVQQQIGALLVDEVVGVFERSVLLTGGCAGKDEDDRGREQGEAVEAPRSKLTGDVQR